jgi:hypothetical protein
MDQRKPHLIEFGISVTSGLCVAAVSGLATVLGSNPATPIPLWVIVGGASLIGLVVVSGAAYINASRREQRLRQRETELAALQRSFVDMRELARSVAQLIKDEPDHSTREVFYTVDPKGDDRIESVWEVRYAAAHQGRVFITEDWSTYPTLGDVTCTCESEDPKGSSILPVLVVDEPTRKSLALYLDPQVGCTPRRLRLKQTWPDLWRDLRERGADYVEMTARPGLKRAETKIYIPQTIGRFRWKANANKAIKLSLDESGAQQTLTMLIEKPEAGQTYRADIEKTT